MNMTEQEETMNNINEEIEKKTVNHNKPENRKRPEDRERPEDRKRRPRGVLAENRLLILTGLAAILVLLLLLIYVGSRWDPAGGDEKRIEKKTEEGKKDKKRRPVIPQDPEEETEEPFVPSEATTKEDKAGQVTEEDFYEALKDMGRKIHSSGLKYNGNAGHKTFEGADDFNCALYVSWTLQKLKLIPSGKTFWFDDKGHGGGFSYMKKDSDRFEIYYPRVPIHSSALLKPGDICGMKINGYAPHTAVYAGRDGKGRMLWYSAGRTDFRKMAKKDFKPIRFKYYEQNNDTLYVIVRIRFDQKEES